MIAIDYIDPEDGRSILLDTGSVYWNKIPTDPQIQRISVRQFSQ
jgi:hypothetical protein